MKTRIKLPALLLTLGLATAHTPVWAGSVYDVPSLDEGIVVVIDEFLWHLNQDVRVNHIFFEQDAATLRNYFLALQHSCAELNGVCGAGVTNKGPVPAPLLIGNAEFTIMQQHLDAALEQRQLPSTARQLLLQKLVAVVRSQNIEQPLASL